MSDHAIDQAAAGGKRSVNQLLKQLIHIGIALTSERELAVLLERIVTEARQFTNAEAASLYLRDGDTLRLTAAQTVAPGEARPLASESLGVSSRTIAGHVALTGRPLCLPGASQMSGHRPYAFSQELDLRLYDQSGSLLVVPLHDASRDVIGVLKVLNACDEAGNVVAFDPEIENLMQALAAQAAVAIRNARLEELSFRDSLTGVYNRRYFTLRLEEEARRHARFAEPVSLVLVDVDRFKSINDELGHRAGDDALRETANLLVANSRSFSIVTRYGGDEFAVLLVNTPKDGAIKYAQRIRDVVEHHRFAHGAQTVSLGIASLPDDVLSWEDLVPAADRALYVAKRLGRNTIEIA